MRANGGYRQLNGPLPSDSMASTLNYEMYSS
jgi:hypothetical protein